MLLRIMEAENMNVDRILFLVGNLAWAVMVITAIVTITYNIFMMHKERNEN